MSLFCLQCLIHSRYLRRGLENNIKMLLRKVKDVDVWAGSEYFSVEFNAVILYVL